MSLLLDGVRIKNGGGNMLFANAAAHFCVDGLCATVLFGKLPAEKEFLILLYNTLAFSTQCIVGLLADRLKRQAGAELCSALLLLSGWILPLPPILRVVLIGFGNSLFHVTGGIETLQRCHGKSWSLGVFVAPGALGLSLGVAFPQFGGFFAAGVFLFVCCACLMENRSLPDTVEHTENDSLTEPILLTVAVAVRAVGGSAVYFPWKTGLMWTMILTVFVVLGKIAGGFLCDCLGPSGTALWTVPAAAVLVAFLSAYAVPSVIGQFLVNLSMPVTLWLLFRMLPDAPGFAFGLAASALWPGTIAGQMMILTGPALWVCVLISFCFSLAAILLADRKLHPTSVRKEN